MDYVYSVLIGVLFGALIMAIYNANRVSQEKLSICFHVVKECEDYINAGTECDFETIKWCIKP